MDDIKSEGDFFCVENFIPKFSKEEMVFLKIESNRWKFVVEIIVKIFIFVFIFIIT